MAAYRYSLAAGCKASIVTLDGRMIAYGNWEVVAGDPAMLGHGWREWLAPGDVERLLLWFSEPVDSGPIVYRVTLADRVVATSLVKTWMDGAWLVIGCEAVVTGRLAGPASPAESERRDRAGHQ